MAEKPERAGEPEADERGDEKTDSNAKCSCAEDEKFSAVRDIEVVKVHEGEAEGGEDDAGLDSVQDTPVRGGGFEGFEGEGLEEEAAGVVGGEGEEGFGGVDVGEDLFLDGCLGAGGEITADGSEDDPEDPADR